MKNSNFNIMVKFFLLQGILLSAISQAEVQYSVSLTTSQLLPGDSASFTSTQVSGASANATGTLYYTYAGAMKFSLSTATGRYAGLAGTSVYGINLGPFYLFQNFLSTNYFTTVSSSTACPNATTYNWLSVRVRSPFPTNSPFAMNATRNWFYFGGTLTYDPNAGNLITGNSMFDLNGPTLNSSPNYTFNGLNSTTCSNGSVRVVGSGTDSPLDNRGYFYLGDKSFLFTSGLGNPISAIGVPVQTLSAPSMASFADSVFTGLYTAFATPSPESSTQVKKNILVFPDSLGTTFSLYNANDLDDPSNKTLLGTIACTNLNSPSNGFCRGTLSLDGVGGTGKAVCMISNETPEWLLACTAQHPADNRIGISIITRVPLKSLLSVSLDQTYYSAAPGGSAAIVATLRNLSGKAISTMGDPASVPLQLAAPFSNSGSYLGTGGTCGSSLAGYSSCNVNITYNPSAVGTHLQTFRVAYDDGYYGTVNATAKLIGVSGLSSITVSPSTASFSAGSTVQYTANATYTDMSTQDITSAVNWSSDNTSVATISSNGVANFSQTGSVNLTATLASVSDSQGVSSTSGGTVEVLGQSSPDGLEGALTGLSGPTQMVVAGGRLFLSDTTNNRVLIWDAIPTSFDTPADLVLGQPDLDTRTANSGGISAQSLSAPRGIASDGTRLVVADSANNRVLIWNTLPTVTEQAADVVLGQTDFSTATRDQGGISLATLDGPYGVAIAGTGASADLIVADRTNHRALIWNTFPTSNKQAANLVLGQSAGNQSSANAGGSVAANTLNAPEGLSTDGTRLFLADYSNNRVLMWDSIPTSTQQAADRVIGQPDLVSNTANNGGQSAATLRSPTGVYVTGTYLYISDNQNHRVIIFTTLPSSNGASANLVLGQSAFNTRTANQGGIGASTLNAPTGMFVQSTKLFIIDNANNRVLIWPTIPTANKEAATQLIGQANYTRNEANSEGLPDSSSLRNPSSVASCGTKLFVADTNNSRVLIWNTIPTSNGQAADVVLGQPDFDSSTANNGGRSSSTLNAPTGVFCDGTRLYVGDTGNNRVLIWNTIPTVNQTAANLVLGQSAFNTATANQGGLGAATLSAPRGIYVSGAKLFVADRSNNRVLVWNAIPTTNKQAADFALGQPDLTSNTANNGGLSASTLSTPYAIHGDGTVLFIADYGNNRVLKWNSTPSASGTAADLVLGQSTFATNTANQGGVGAATLRNPGSVFTDGTSLYIADYTNHRVLIHDTYPTTNKEAADRVLGQPNFTGVTLNNGGIDANSLYNPLSVYSDSHRVFIADYNNFRITIVSVKATLSISDGPTYNYGDVALSGTAIRTFTITNLGAQTASAMTAGTPALATPFSFVGGSYPGTSGTCGATLAGQATCTIRVQFNPTAEAATFSDVVRVSYDAGGATKVAVVGVTGRAVNQSSLTFTAGASYNYGNVNVGSGSDYTFTVSNASGVLATQMKQGTPALVAPYAFKGGQYPGAGGTCGTVLSNGSTCTLVIRFSPTSLGVNNKTFYLSYYNGSATTTVSINLTGTGN